LKDRVEDARNWDNDGNKRVKHEAENDTYHHYASPIHPQIVDAKVSADNQAITPHEQPVAESLG
jgi:hypothetical protein